MAKPILDDIQLFIEIARNGSFKRAATAVDMPPATLSRRMAELETRIGLTLLNRSTRSVHLTSAGKSYLEQCGPLLDSLRQAHEDISRSVLAPSGTLRLTCTPDFGSLYLPPVIKRYALENPNVSIELSLGSNIEDLVNQTFDLAIRMGNLPASSLIGRQIATLQPVLCASVTYLNAHPAIVQPSDLAMHRCIRVSSNPSSGIWQLTHAIHGTQHVRTDARLVAGSPSMALALALEDMGVALIDPRAAAPYLESGRLRQLLPEWAPMGIKVNVLSTSRLVPPRARVFIEHLQASVQ